MSPLAHIAPVPHDGSMKTIVLALTLTLSTGCAATVAGLQGFSGHRLGPGQQPAEQPQGPCVTNYQCHAVGAASCSYVTAYQTCGSP